MHNLAVRNASRNLMGRMLAGGIAALLLLWGLGNPYLWQDEAATAVLAQRMLRFGRPLAYDGVNLITIDHFAAENANSIDQRTASAQAAVEYYIRRGDLKADTSWKWQPWGQFVVAALSFKIFGATTIAARLPFALAGIITVLLLYRFVLTYFDNPQMAWLAAIFLALNAYWVLHCRQCRYYSLSSLLLVLTLASYARCQWGKSDRSLRNAALFVVSAWIWFQVDYGTVWPVLGILFVDAVVAERRTPSRPVLVGLALAAAIAPFVYYYELWDRFSAAAQPWRYRFLQNLFNLNEYVVPGVIVIAALALLVSRWKILPAVERRLVAISCAVIVVLLFWVPATAPIGFLRYVIMAAPLGCLLVAWVLVRMAGARSSYLWAGAAIFVLTPWLSLPLRAAARFHGVSIFRPELRLLWSNVFGHRPDPNRSVIDWLRQNAKPTDEILINYEDIPLMFYLPNPIRGGIGAFRVEDDAKGPPDFLVLRRSVGFTHWPVFFREIERYSWEHVPLEIPDVPWGNSPDPTAQAFRTPLHMPLGGPTRWIYIARRVPRKSDPEP